MLVNKYSQIYKLSQYILPVDLGLMATVLSQKQQKYDTNKQLLNQSVQSILNMDLVRDDDKEYLKQKSNQVVSYINGLGSVDLSNNGVVSNIQGTISKIGQDERISNNLLQSKKYRLLQKNIEDIYKLKMEGKKDILYNSVTEWYDSQRMSEYINSKDPNAVFKGSTTLTLWSDWKGKMDEAIKQIELEIFTQYENVDGYSGLLMHKVSREIILKSKIREIAINSLDLESKKSMQLEALYNYKSFTLDQLKADANNHFAKSNIELDNQIDQLKYSLLLVSTEKRSAIEDNIKKLEKRRDELKSQRDDFINNIDSNFESSKISLFNDKMLSNISNQKSKNKIIKDEIELNQAQVKINDWARQDAQNNIENNLAERKFQRELNNDMFENQYKQAQTMKIMSDLKESTGLHYQLDNSGNVSISSLNMQSDILGIYLNSNENDKTSYGDSLDDEILKSNENLSKILRDKAADLIYRVTKKTRLSTITESGMEVEVKDVLKNLDKYKLSKDDLGTINRLFQLSKDASLGKILNELNIDDIETINRFNSEKTYYQALIKKRDDMKITALRDVMDSKGLKKIETEVGINALKFKEKYDKWLEDRLVLFRTLTFTTEQAYKQFLRENLNLVKSYLAYKKYFLDTGVLSDYEEKGKEYISKISTRNLSKVLIFLQEELNRNKNLRTYNALEAKLLSEKSNAVTEDGKLFEMTTDQKITQIVGFHLTKGVLVMVGNQTSNLDNKEDGKELQRKLVYIKLNLGEEDILGSLSSYAKANTLYKGYEDALKIGNSVEYQVLHKNLLIRAEVVRRDLTNNSSQVDIFIKVLTESGETDIKLDQVFNNFTSAAIFLNTLVGEADKNGIKDINDLYKKMKVK